MSESSEMSGLDDAKTNKEFSEGDKCIEKESSKEVENCIKEVPKISATTNNNSTDKANSTIFLEETNEEQDSIAENKELQVVRNVNKISRIIDSDSEDEDTFNVKAKEVTGLNNLFEDKKHSNEESSKKLFDSDTDDDTYVNLNKSNTEEKIRTGFRTLVDSDSEEEVNETHLNPMEDKELKQQKKHGESTKRKVSLRASKEEAMKQIQSETQRLVRETEISLPYHRPKQRTLQEFLNRRKVLSALPKAPTMAAKLKMSSAIIDKVLKEKEKEAETFYKSSDSEEETTESHSMIDHENANAEYIQKFEKEIVPKKLFVDELSVNNKEDNNTSVINGVNGNITEINKTKSSLPMETDTVQTNNTNELQTLKNNCDITTAENTNEHILPKIMNEIEESHEERDVILQDEIIENKDKELHMVKKNPHGNCDNEKYNLQTDDDSSNESSSNVTDYAKMVKQSLGITAEESDEYNEYGLSPPKLDITPKDNEKKTLLSIRNTTPKLRGTPGTVIDLTGDIKPNKNAINAFLDRFVYKHSKLKNEANNTSKVTVTQMIESPDGSSIKVKETLPYKFKNSEKVDPKLKKPGAKLLLLKQELKEKIALKREEEWKEKELEMKEHDIEWNETFDEGDKFDKSSSIATYESEEDELEEDDICEKKEKKRRKCEFVDDEADVSDDEVDDQDGIIDEDEDENFEKDEERLILEDDGSSTCDSIDIKRKSFRRIVEPIEDDSRSCDTLNDKVVVNMDNEKCLSSTVMLSDMFHKSPSENEKDIPVSQAHIENDLEHKLNHTPLSRKTNNFSFVSPATQLTALSTCLENLEQMTQIRQESLIEESNPNLIESPQIGELSQQCNSDSRSTMPKKLLFNDQNDITEDELVELCSGKFMTCDPGMNNSLDYSKLSGATAFHLPDSEDLDKNSQESATKRNSASAKRDATHEQLKGDYDSREKSRVLSNTDDENEDLMMQEITNRTKKKAKRLELSDDEEENECSVFSDDDIQSECDEDKIIDYDSEENEVVIPKKNIKQYAATFLENEAELSESDCDVSADEDEKDMDDLELEEGDNEEIDETQVKNQLGKLHMKQILDEDQKEVRILKELLFEEGDLFSESGRERKFKWKNINKQDTNDQVQPCEDKDSCVDLSDEEDEAKWRKIRHEREKFLAEKMINVDTEIENDLNNSQIFKFGMKILKKRRINENQTENTLLDSSVSAAKPKIPHTIADMLNSSNLKGNSDVIHNVLRKRSILARGEESLARLAALARRKDAPLFSKNAKKFVFTHIDTEEDTTTETVVKTGSQRYKVKRKN